MPKMTRIDWLALEARIKTILREGFQDHAEACSALSMAQALWVSLHRIDATLGARLLRGEQYPGNLESLDRETREARESEWDRVS